MHARNRFLLRSRACNRKLREKLDDERGIRGEALQDYLEREGETRFQKFNEHTIVKFFSSTAVCRLFSMSRRDRKPV